MNENSTIKLAEIPLGGKGGFVWNRLHGEREDICEALLNPASHAHERRESLEAGLRSLDDALDRLISGSYGICANCRHAIGNATLEVDPACVFCVDCSECASNVGRVRNEDELNNGDSRYEIILKTLNAFDTILLHTQNSDYRILLLDPGTGRALVEGGTYLPEPGEGVVTGSALPASAFNAGAICVGGRLEMWVDKKVLLTSPVQSVEVKQNAAAESAESIAAALHEPIA
jgi:RNA polymerase-binding transcription factor DksA